MRTIKYLIAAALAAMLGACSTTDTGRVLGPVDIVVEMWKGDYDGDEQRYREDVDAELAELDLPGWLEDKVRDELVKLWNERPAAVWDADAMRRALQTRVVNYLVSQ